MKKYLLLLLLLLPSPAFGAWSVVNQVCAWGGDGVTLTSGAINTTGANLIVLYVTSYIGRSAATITDSATNTWHTLTDPASISHSFLAYAYNATPNASHTFTATQAAGLFNAVVCVVALSGSLTSDPFDQESSASDSGVSSFSPGTITPTQANEIVINGIASDAQASPLSINGGFTIAVQAYNTGESTVGIAYLIQTTATASNPAWTTDTGSGQTGQASFKIFAAPAGGARRRVVVVQ